jgi:hypothetical protein
MTAPNCLIRALFLLRDYLDGLSCKFVTDPRPEIPLGLVLPWTGNKRNFGPGQISLR